MPRIVSKRAYKLGLAPGSIITPPRPGATPVTITVYDYSPEGVEEHVCDSPEDCFLFRDRPTQTWINIDGIHDAEILRTLGAHYGLHPLTLEDIASTSQRPKVEEYEGYIYIVAKMISFVPQPFELKIEQVSLILGANFVLSFQEEPGDVFNPIRERLRGGKGRMRQMGADYLAYALLDIIVDYYFVVLEHMGERIETLEEAILQTPDFSTQKKIRDLRRELIQMRRAVWPLRELFSALERTESALIRPATRPFLRDAYDHTIQIIDVVESLRDVLSGLMDLYMSSLSNKMNEIMKFLTIIGTIFIPLTFIAGIYGMNFDNMPELHTRYGYPLAMGIMLALGLSLLYYFRRRDWI